ncbi:MAG: hypothetical protein KF718_29515 [Polyangiaceae bacterium]|nr:hypothetical protein [Polyangiaceae bacterium]
MPVILMLAMEGQSVRAEAVTQLSNAGHQVVVVEPRFPECKGEIEKLTPGLVLVDGAQAPSHGRATAAWLAGVARFRTVPFLFLDVPDRDVPKVKKELPRAQLGTWSAVVGAAERLAKSAR